MLERIRVPALGALVLWGFSSGVPSNRQELTVEGSVVCLDGQRREVGCDADSRDFGLREADGSLWLFSREDTKTRMFWDGEVRSRKLRIQAWARDGRALDIIKVFSLRNGQLYDLHYFCSVCNITAYAGGPCWCCQDDFVLREVPLQP